MGWCVAIIRHTHCEKIHTKIPAVCVVSTRIYSGVYFSGIYLFRGVFFQEYIYSEVYFFRNIFIQGFIYSRMFLFSGLFIQGYLYSGIHLFRDIFIQVYIYSGYSYSGVFNFSMCGNSAIGFCSVCACFYCYILSSSQQD